MEGGIVVDSVVLSKPARKLLKALCQEYARRKDDGKDDVEARMFGGSEVLQREILPKWPTREIDAACRELHQADLINAFFANCMLAEMQLLPAGTSFYQQSGQRLIRKGISFLMELLPFFH